MEAQGLDGKSRLVAVYFAGATHIFEFCKPMGISAFKAGVTACRDPCERILDLRRSRYAELFKRPNDPSDGGILLPNADEWFLSPLARDRLRPATLPDNIDIIDGYLALRVPTAISVETVDIAIHTLLRARTLRDFLVSPDGQQRMVGVGHDPKRWFHTTYKFVGKAPRITMCEELYLIRPHKELGAFVSALAKLLQTWSAASALLPERNESRGVCGGRARRDLSTIPRCRW
jgi:hypothetical protein